MILSQLQQYPGWGNARDIIAMWKIILEQRASRVVGAPEKQKTITKTDTKQAVNKMVADRKPKGDRSTIKRKQEEEKMQKIKEQLNQMSIFFTICFLYSVYSVCYFFSLVYRRVLYVHGTSRPELTVVA